MSEPASSTLPSPSPAPSTDRPRLVICAKSRWEPAIRREHGLSAKAVATGYDIEFVQQAYDLRDLRRPGLVQRLKPFRPLPHVVVSSQLTPVPGHRDGLARWSDALTLRRVLAKVAASGPTPTAVVVNAPWNWPATSALPPGTRRVLDVGDDWATLMPHRRERVLSDYRRISAEADAIVVVAPSLADLFDREVHVVPNAVGPGLLDTPPVPAPGRRRMTYVGTLSERFDSTLMAEVLDRLPDWSLELYGPCQYAGRGHDPGQPLEDLLARFPERVRWHGIVPRTELGRVLDESDVLVLPNDAAISGRQDSMKLYDYAARARPVVATPIRVPDDAPEALALAADPASFAEAVQRLDGADCTSNRRFAERNGWDDRLPLWLEAVTGVAP